jgi:RNA recognition motif-containing protein
MRPTCASKDLEKLVIWNFIKQEFKGCFHLKKSCREPIDKKTGCSKGITPKPKRNGGMSK